MGIVLKNVLVNIKSQISTWHRIRNEHKNGTIFLNSIFWELPACYLSLIHTLVFHTYGEMFLVYVTDLAKKKSSILLILNGVVLILVQSRSHIQLFETPWTVTHQAPLSMGFPGKNTGMGCHFLFQRIFPTQGLNPRLLHLLHWEVDSSPLC